MTASKTDADDAEQSTERGQHGGHLPGTNVPDDVDADPASGPFVGAHWWLDHDVEAPDWYVERFGASTVTDEAPQRCTNVPTPEVPDEVPWTEYTWYRCDGCGWSCIEHEDSEAAQKDLCWCCVAGEELPDGRDITEAYIGGASDEEVRHAVETAEQEASR